MNTEKFFLENIKNGQEFTAKLMIMKILHKDPEKIVVLLADKSGDLKGTLQNQKDDIDIGTVIEVQGIKDNTINIKSYSIIQDYNLDDFLPCVKRPIEDIMKDIEELSKKYILSPEGRALDDYFFTNEEFLQDFKRGIGGVAMHHNYIGGLAEHTLNVMYLTSVLCERYNCRNTEIAVLSAKLHDIGKLQELDYKGPFKYTLRGSLEGHIILGTQMINNAFKELSLEFSEDFKNRIRGCIVQHHGKLEYGSPRERNLEESFIVNYADTIDATMNRIVQIKDKTEINTWSEYDRKLETKLFL